MRCQKPTLHLRKGEDRDFDIVHKDEDDKPTDCTGWSIAASVWYNDVALGITPSIAFTAAEKGEAVFSFTVEEVALIQPTRGAELRVRWTSAEGKRETSIVLLDVCP
jgi:hypothetical protein